MADLTTLTGKQRAFVDEYLRTFNATRAAIDAGYSEKTAYSIGWENLRKPEIIEAVSAELDKRAMSASEVLFHLTEIARADVGDLLDSSGNLDMKAARKYHKTRLIKRVKSKSYTTEESDVSEQEVELYDRLRALELLAKYHDLINRIKIDDWRSEAIRMIRRSEVTFEALSNEIGNDLASTLFAEAGIAVRYVDAATTGETE